MRTNTFAQILAFAAAFYFFPQPLLAADEYPSIKTGGFLAPQFIYDQSENVQASNEWKFKHARFQVEGFINEKLNGFAQIETNTGTVLLQNAFINLAYIPGSEIRAGYIKLPFGIEAYGHPLMNPAIDISQASKKIYRGAHDMGVHLKYGYGIATGWAALVNGNNNFTTDNNSSKDFSGKLLLAPIKGLSTGGSFYYGKTDTAELTTNRAGAEINYGNGPWWARGEFLFAKDRQAAGNNKNSMGYYATLAYEVFPAAEGVVRYDGYDPDTDSDGNEWGNITLGMNYYFSAQKWNRVALNYEIREDEANAAIGNLLTAQLQVLF